MKTAYTALYSLALTTGLAAAACGSAPDAATQPEALGNSEHPAASLDEVVARVGLKKIGPDTYQLHDMLFDGAKVLRTFTTDPNGLTGRINGTWSPQRRYDLRYCVSTNFGGDHDRVLTGMQRAIGAWTLEAGAGIAFHYLASEDANCNKQNGNVDISVSYGGDSGVTGALANSDVGPDPTQHTQINVFQSGVRLADESTSGVDLKATITHELGHTLGFYHEQDNPASNGCAGGKWDSQHQSLTPYDPPSVMHYNAGQSAGCPSTTYMALTENDKKGAQIAYPRAPVVELANERTGQCVTVDGGSPGGAVHLEACAKGANQLFRVVASNGGQLVVAEQSGFLLGDAGGAGRVGAFPVTSVDTNTASQVWHVAGAGVGAHLHMVAPSGLCLSSAGEAPCDATGSDPGQWWQQVVQPFVPTENDYHRSYGRGAGTVPTECGAGMEKQGALCYPACQPGYYGVGPVCWQYCPPGYADDGATCRLDPSTVSADNSNCPWYDKCGLTFAAGCSYCPDGYANDGCTCTRGGNIFAKSSYGRGAGSPLSCAGGLQYDAGLCYDACTLGFHGVGPVCYEDAQAAVPTGFVKIASQPSGLALGVRASDTTLGTPILAWPWQGTNNELFRFTPTPDGDGDFYIQSQLSNECLGVTSSSLASGATVVEWSCDGTPNQRFSLTALGGGAWYIAAKHSGRCLSVPQGGGMGAQIDQEDCGALAAEQFVFP